MPHIPQVVPLPAPAVVLPPRWSDGAINSAADCETAAATLRDYLALGAYAFVSSISAIDHLDVRTDQSVTSVSVDHHDHDHAQVIVSDSYGVWDFSWIRGMEVPPRLWHRGERNITIKHRSGGLDITWIIASQLAGREGGAA